MLRGHPEVTRASSCAAAQTEEDDDHEHDQGTPAAGLGCQAKNQPCFGGSPERLSGGHLESPLYNPARVSNFVAQLSSLPFCARESSPSD